MFEPCGKCKDGYIYSGDSAVKCSCLIEYQRSIITQVRLSRSGVYDEVDLSWYKGPDIEGNVSKIKKYVDGLTEKFSKNSHLYFVGPNGSQKTFTSKAIIKEAVLKNLSCKFVLMNDLIKKLTDIYEDGYNSTIDEYYSCSLLVIDDCFDPKKVTVFKSGYQIPYLDEFLRKRIEQFGGNIIFTSNIPIKDIDENKFSKDIKNLLKRSISDKGGELYFNDIYSSMENKDILNMWS